MKVKMTLFVLLSLFLLLPVAHSQTTQPLKLYLIEIPASLEAKKYKQRIDLEESAFEKSYHMFHFKDVTLTREEIDMHVENFFYGVGNDCTNRLKVIPFPGLLMCYQSKNKNIQILTGGTWARVGFIGYYKF